MATQLVPKMEAGPSPEITGGIVRLESWAQGLVVKTEGEYVHAVETLKLAKGYRQKVVDFFAPMKKRAYDAWKGVCATEAQFTTRLDGIEKTAKAALIAYQRREEEKRLAEQRRLQAEADERARKEAERLAARAEKAEQSGKAEKAEALREEAAGISAPVIQVASATPKIEGASVRKIWKARVIDSNRVPREFLVVNEKALDAFAKATKGAVPVAGVEFYEEANMAVGRW